MKTQDGAPVVRDPVFLAERGISKKGVTDRKLDPSAQEIMPNTSVLKDSQIPITVHSDTLTSAKRINVGNQPQPQMCDAQDQNLCVSFCSYVYSFTLTPQLVPRKFPWSLKEQEAAGNFTVHR